MSTSCPLTRLTMLPLGALCLFVIVMTTWQHRESPKLPTSMPFVVVVFDPDLKVLKCPETRSYEIARSQAKLIDKARLRWKECGEK